MRRWVWMERCKLTKDTSARLNTVWCGAVQLRKEFAERSLASSTAHKASVAAEEKELQRLQDNAIEVIMLGEHASRN